MHLRETVFTKPSRSEEQFLFFHYARSHGKLRARAITVFVSIKFATVVEIIVVVCVLMLIK